MNDEDENKLNDKKISHKPKGLYVPNVVFGNPNLSYFEKFLFPVIETLDGSKGCFASNEYLANIMGVSIATMSAGIANLIQQKYIKLVSFDGNFLH